MIWQVSRVPPLQLNVILVFEVPVTPFFRQNSLIGRGNLNLSNTHTFSLVGFSYFLQKPKSEQHLSTVGLRNNLWRRIFNITVHV